MFGGEERRHSSDVYPQILKKTHVEEINDVAEMINRVNYKSGGDLYLYYGVISLTFLVRNVHFSSTLVGPE